MPLGLKLSRQLAQRLTEAKHDRFAAFVHLPTRVIKRVHRHVGKNKQIRLRPEAFQHVFQQTLKVFQILRCISEYQKLRERQLPFTEYSKTRNQRLTTISLLHHSRGERMKPSLTICPKIAH